MDFVLLDDIIIPSTRQRRDFDPSKITELAESIHQVGLMHPIVVRNDGKTLVAGERRIKAIRQLVFLNKHFSCHGSPVFQGTAPVVKLAELSATQVFEAELSENVIREDLSWQERAEALSKLQELRSQQAGAHISHGVIADEVYGRRDGNFGGRIKDQLMVARHLDNPEVAKAKSLADAVKVIKVREQQREYAEAGERLPHEILKDKHRLVVGDFRTASLPAGTFSVIITDPPYGIDMDKAEGGGGPKATAGHLYEDSSENWPALMNDLAFHSYSLCTENAHVYTFCDFARFFTLKSIYESHGFRVFLTPFIMYRTTSVRAPWKEEGPWKSYECILYAIKGHRPCRIWRTDVITCRGDENLGHGAQKPVSVYVDLLERSAAPGESVLDLCAGSGTIFPAAHGLKLIATGVELIPANAAIAAKRLEDLK